MSKQIAVVVLCMPREAQKIINCRMILSVTALILHWVSFCHCQNLSLLQEMSCIIYHVLVRFAVHKYGLKTQLQFQVIFMFLSFEQVVYKHTLNIFKGINFTAILKAYYLNLAILINILKFCCCLYKIKLLLFFNCSSSSIQALSCSSVMEISQPQSTLCLSQLQ